MDRTIYYTQEQLRSFDLLWSLRDVMTGVAFGDQDILGQAGMVGGLAATPTSPASLQINLAAGRIYQNAVIDGTTYGSLAADTNLIMQQGFAAAQPITLSTSALSSGQSQWVLIEASFQQVDAIRSGDPTSGVLYYYNSANPSQPFQGPGGNGTANSTVRTGVMSITPVYGSPAATGTEAPPSPTAGALPLYLIDLTFGQTTITSGQILVAAPSVGVNVPSNYPHAPFIAGLLNSHHGGFSGQAPKIQLGSAQEVQGVLPLANMPASSSTGGIGVQKQYAGNPNGFVAGNANVNGASDMVWDTVNLVLWICTVTGPASTAVWAQVGGSPDIGVVKQYAGLFLPASHLWANGSAVSRTVYANLFSVISAGATATLANGSAILSNVSVDFTTLGVTGAHIEGAGIPAGTTILSGTTNTLTLSQNATVSNSGVAIRVFPYGNGDGATTFNVPDYQERIAAGRGGMGGASDPGRLTTATMSLGGTTLNSSGGGETHVLTVAELAAHNHTDLGHTHGVADPTHSHGYNTFVAGTAGQSVGTNGAGSPSPATTTASSTGITINTGNANIQNNGSNAAHNNVQPTLICNFIIRY